MEFIKLFSWGKYTNISANNRTFPPPRARNRPFWCSRRMYKLFNGVFHFSVLSMGRRYICFCYRGLDVNIVIFYRSPKSFYPDVVLCPAPAVHTDLHFRMLSTRFFPIQAGDLTPLIRVYNLRCSVLRDGVFEHLYAVWRIQRIMKAPAHDIWTKEEIAKAHSHDSQIHKQERDE